MTPQLLSSGSPRQLSGQATLKGRGGRHRFVGSAGFQPHAGKDAGDPARYRILTRTSLKRELAKVALSQIYC
jgi:hypothetical protein